MTITISSQVNNSATAPTQTTLQQYALAQLGLLQPEAAIARRRTGTPLLPTQPTVAAWTTTSTLTTGKLLPVQSGSGPYTVSTTAPYRYFGSNFVLQGQTYPDYLFVHALNVAAEANGVGLVDIETDAPTFEISLKGTGTSGRLFVDNYDGQGLGQITNAGAWAATTAFAANKTIKPSSNNPDGHTFSVSTAGTTSGSQPTWSSAAGVPGQSVTDGTVIWLNQGVEAPLGAPPPIDGQLYFLPVTFATRRWRRVVWESTAQFAGIKVGKTDTIRRCGVPLGPRTIIMGDSFTEGTGGSVGWVARFAHLRGQLDTWESGEGGTGYLNNAGGAGGKTTLRGRVATDINPYSPDIVIVAAGLNDGSSAAAMQAEASLLYQAIKAGSLGITTGRPPIVIVVGPFTINGTIGSSATAVGVRDGIRAAAVQYADCYIETLYGAYPYTAPITNYVNNGTDTALNPQLWWSGSGKVSAPAGDGNSDFLVWSDGTHPTDHGHMHLAQRVDAGIEQWRAAGCSTGFVATP